MGVDTSSKAKRAAVILSAYWGTTGLDRVLRRGELRDLKLKSQDVEDLLDDLPPRGSTGTTGQRVDECYRVLEQIADSKGLFGQ
jgi:hypothetical protein